MSGGPAATTQNALLRRLRLAAVASFCVTNVVITFEADERACPLECKQLFSRCRCTCVPPRLGCIVDKHEDQLQYLHPQPRERGLGVLKMMMMEQDNVDILFFFPLALTHVSLERLQQGKMMSERCRAAGEALSPWH